MTHDPDTASLVQALLDLVHRRPIVAADAEAGLDILAANAGREASRDAWREAVAAALASGCIAEPVRLDAGALHCHWRLELTPRGFAAVAHRRAQGRQA
ncbi:MAG: hypothetical protein JOY70_06115 [Acidisphaera sp.]|nr:hypothetical protein [Acidisphaera sp.]MBV9812927.1 hypothetical protein [Acetobacteraceae bacterium]